MGWQEVSANTTEVLGAQEDKISGMSMMQINKMMFLTIDSPHDYLVKSIMASIHTIAIIGILELFGVSMVEANVWAK